MSEATASFESELRHSRGEYNLCFSHEGRGTIIQRGTTFLEKQRKKKEMMLQRYPVAIVGAGPIGLAAAAHLIGQGETPLIFEAGDSIGAAILAWGHVHLFSPWRYLIDQQARAILEAQGWQAPDPEAYPTGR